MVILPRSLLIGKLMWALTHGPRPIHEAGRRNCYRLLVQADGAQVPFPQGYFASAFSNSVLEHIPHIDDVLADTARVLKPGAPFYFCVPNERYLSELSISHLLGKGYTEWFRRISRVQHADGPQVGRTAGKGGIPTWRNGGIISPRLPCAC